MRRSGEGILHPPQHLDRARARLAPAHAPMAHDRLDDLLADRVARVERGHRLLEDHRQAVAAQVAQLPGREAPAGRCRRTAPRRRRSAEPFGSRPMMASEVTLLPQPDSPTRPSVAPFATLRSTLSTAWVVRPPSPRKSTFRSAISTEAGRCRPFHPFARGPPHPSPPSPRDRFRDVGLELGAIDEAGRILARRQELAEMRPALAAHRFQPRQLGERIGVVVDAQVEIGPFVLAVDQQRGRLLAALVAARRFARLHGGDQPARERQRRVGAIGGGGVVEHARPGQHVAGEREALARDVPAPIDAGLRRYGRRCGRGGRSCGPGGDRGRRRARSACGSPRPARSRPPGRCRPSIP